jgi:hypothetical protein
MRQSDEEIIQGISDLTDRLAEDKLYQVVANEMKSGFYDEIAQLRSLESAAGDEIKAKSYYARNRVRRLLDLKAESIFNSLSQKEKRKSEDDERRRVRTRICAFFAVLVPLSFLVSIYVGSQFIDIVLLLTIIIGLVLGVVRGISNKSIYHTIFSLIIPFYGYFYYFISRKI